ncbi:hypothetical protein THAOC_06085, partial [Thalassiosira oceanica]
AKDAAQCRLQDPGTASTPVAKDAAQCRLQDPGTASTPVAKDAAQCRLQDPGTASTPVAKDAAQCRLQDPGTASTPFAKDAAQCRLQDPGTASTPFAKDAAQCRLQDPGTASTPFAKEECRLQAARNSAVPSVAGEMSAEISCATASFIATAKIADTATYFLPVGISRVAALAPRLALCRRRVLHFVSCIVCGVRGGGRERNVEAPGKSLSDRTEAVGDNWALAPAPNIRGTKSRRANEAEATLKPACPQPSRLPLSRRNGQDDVPAATPETAYVSARRRKKSRIKSRARSRRSRAVTSSLANQVFNERTNVDLESLVSQSSKHQDDGDKEHRYKCDNQHFCLVVDIMRQLTGRRKDGAINLPTDSRRSGAREGREEEQAARARTKWRDSWLDSAPDTRLRSACCCFFALWLIDIGVDDGGGPQAWFQSLPLVTRYWFGGALLATCAGNFGFISVMKLIYVWDDIWTNFAIWRLLTPFLFVGKFDFNTLMCLYMLQSFSQRYETEPYNTGAGGGTADYVAMIMRHPTAPASIWGIQMKAIYLPFAYVALSVLMGGAFSDLVHGIAVGHFYYFIVDVVPLVYGKDYFHTPQFLIDQLGVGAYIPAPTAEGRGGVGNNTWAPPGRANPPSDPARPARGHDWGNGGQRLGAS